MTWAKIIFLFSLSALAACGKHAVDNSSFIRPSSTSAGENASIFLDIKNGQMEEFKTKLAGVSDINQVYEDGNTLLTFATEQNKPAIVKYLLDQGADPALSNKGGANALDIAKSHNHLAIWLMLDPSKQVEEQEVLFQAVLNKKAPKLDEQLKAGVNPNFVHSTGETPLTQAVKMKNLGAITQLGKWKDPNGVTSTDLEMPNADGRAPYDLAVELNDTKVLNAFKKLGFP